MQRESGEQAGVCLSFRAASGYPARVTPPRVSVHHFFQILIRSVADARAAVGADHALVPLEPWASADGETATVTVTLTGRGHLVSTHAGKQVPVLQAEVFPLPAGGALLVGRTSRANLVIDQPTISRLHAELQWREGSFCVLDKGSYNGTMVNHRVLEQGESVTLDDGDVVIFGEAQLVFGSLPHLASLVTKK